MAAWVVDQARGSACKLAVTTLSHHALHVAACVLEHQRSGHHLCRLSICSDLDQVLRGAHVGPLARAVGVGYAAAVADVDARANVWHSVQGEAEGARQQAKRATTRPSHAARSVIGNGVELAQRPILDGGGASFGQGRELGDKDLPCVFFCDLDALGMGRYAHLHPARCAGQQQRFSRSRALVYRSHFRAAVRHDLHIHASEAQPGVVDL